MKKIHVSIIQEEVFTMTRYEKIVKKLFGEGFIRYDEDMIYRIINDLDPSYDQSIDDFRNLVTVFIVDLD